MATMPPPGAPIDLVLGVATIDPPAKRARSSSSLTVSGDSAVVGRASAGTTVALPKAFVCCSRTHVRLRRVAGSGAWVASVLPGKKAWLLAGPEHDAAVPLPVTGSGPECWSRPLASGDWLRLAHMYPLPPDKTTGSQASTGRVNIAPNTLCLHSTHNLAVRVAEREREPAAAAAAAAEDPAADELEQPQQSAGSGSARTSTSSSRSSRSCGRGMPESAMSSASASASESAGSQTTYQPLPLQPDAASSQRQLSQSQGQSAAAAAAGAARRTQEDSLQLLDSLHPSSIASQSSASSAGDPRRWGSQSSASQSLPVSPQVPIMQREGGGGTREPIAFTMPPARPAFDGGTYAPELDQPDTEEEEEDPEEEQTHYNTQAAEQHSASASASGSESESQAPQAAAATRGGGGGGGNSRAEFCAALLRFLGGDATALGATELHPIRAEVEAVARSAPAILRVIVEVAREEFLREAPFQPGRGTMYSGRLDSTGGLGSQGLQSGGGGEAAAAAAVVVEEAYAPPEPLKGWLDRALRVSYPAPWRPQDGNKLWCGSQATQEGGCMSMATSASDQTNPSDQLRSRQ